MMLGALAADAIKNLRFLADMLENQMYAENNSRYNRAQALNSVIENECHMIYRWMFPIVEPERHAEMLKQREDEHNATMAKIKAAEENDCA